MLRDLKILDFSGLLPGPFGTMILGDLGANIITIQKPTQDGLIDGFEVFDSMLKRNKQVIELDLKENTSVNQIKQLIQEYDIIVEGFRPGVMERLGLGYSQLKKINEKIIYCSITGYGQDGENKLKAGHDINYLSISGISSYSGKKNVGPNLPGIQIADLSGSLYLAIALLSSFINRQNTGKGQKIDLSMTDCVFSLGILQNLSFLNSGKIPHYEDSFLTGGSYYGYYETGDGRFISIGSLEPKFYFALCKYFEIDPYSEQQSIKEILQEKFKLKTLDEWVSELVPLDICIEPVLNLSEVVSQKFFKERNNVVEVDTNIGKIKQTAHPIKYSNYEPRYNSANK